MGGSAVFEWVRLRGAASRRSRTPAPRTAAAAVPFALAASIPLLAPTPAQAVCTLVGSTVVCSGSTPAGFDSLGQNALTITILEGAQVADGNVAGRALNLVDFNNVTNLGTIDVTTFLGAGIFATDDNLILNAATGLINVTGGDAVGIFVGDRNVVVNAGRIVVNGAGNAAGVVVNSGSTVTNTGTVSVIGDGNTGLSPGNSTDVTIFNDNLIDVSGAGAVGIFGHVDTAATNRGTINVTGAGAAGMAGIGTTFDGPDFVNNGRINVTAAGAAGVSIRAQGFGGGTLVNNGTIFASVPGSFAIQTTVQFGGSGTDLTNNGLVDGPVSLTPGFGGDLFTNNGTLTVSSAAIPIGNVFAMPGTLFTQSAGGTLGLRVTSNPAVFDMLTADIATLAGTLRAVVQPGLYANVTVFPGVVTTICGCTSNFDRAVSSSPFFTAASALNGFDIDLTLTRVPFNAVTGLTRNQLAVASTLEPLYSVALGGNAATFFSNLLAATSVGVLDQISGQGYSGAQTAAFEAGSFFNAAMTSQGMNGGGGLIFSPAPLAYAAQPQQRGHDAFAAIGRRSAATPGGVRLWTFLFGSRSRLDGEGDPGSMNQRIGTAGLALGVERMLSPDLVAGAAIGGSANSFSAPFLSTSGTSHAVHLGTYAVKRWGSVYAAAGASYARFDNDASRIVAGAGPVQFARGSFAADQIGGRLELGIRQTAGGATVTPFVAFEPAWLRQHGFTESGAGVLALQVASRNSHSLPLSLGAEVSGEWVLSGGAVLSPYARLSWVHEFSPEREISASFVSLPGTAFTVGGPRAARDAARLDAGARLALRENVAAFAALRGEFSGRTTSYSAMGGIRATW